MNWLESGPLYDWFVAINQNTRRSAAKIEPFIRKYQIDMSEFEPGPFRSYAEFFDRTFKDGKRPFPPAPGIMGAFAEARYMAWSRVPVDQVYPIKGHSLDAAQLIGDKDLARSFANGPVVLARLAPMDYHHLHYPDHGQTLQHYRLGRKLWTVNPHALRNQPDILLKNERNINILETTNFGRLGLIEIGALSVGRIVQVHPVDRPFKRGGEKSVFKFGGSAVALFGEAGRWCPSQDLLEKTQEGVETIVKLGQPIAEAIRGEQSQTAR
jgi:phosphatidylserine decarboxylase